jgi:hypothetical protein
MTPSTWRARSPYLYLPGIGWTQLYSQALWSIFVPSYESQGYGGGIRTQSQSQSYFTTGGLPPISSSWRQAPWDTRPEFFQLNSCGNSPYAASSLTRRWVCLLWICLDFVKCTYRTYSMLSKILAFSLHTSPLSVQALQSRSCLSYVSYARTAALSFEES